MRTKNSIQNIFTGIILQVVTIALGFFSRKIFINYIGLDYLGINGLLTSVLSMLGLVELGVGGAIYYSLYKPLADKDEDQVYAIMNLYSKLYKYIGIAVALIGISVMPFLKYIVNTDIALSYVNTVYIIFIIDSFISYFLAYRRNILSADQKNYVINKVTMYFSVLTTFVQIMIIVYTKNYILYLWVKVFSGFVQNLIIYFITNKKYPYLKGKKKVVLNEKTKKEIIKNAKALFIINIACYCVFSTDNILISIFANITYVGVYSNYNLILTMVNQFIGQFFNGIKASFGNFMVEEKKEDIYKLFRKINFFNFFIVSFSSVSLVVLTNLFIELWVGIESVWPILILIILVFNMYSRLMLSSVGIVKDAAGLYSPYPFFKYWAFIEGIINLVVSVFLAKTLNWGIYGVFVGTSVSTIVSTIVMPRVVYRYIFKKSVLEYFKSYILYLGLTAMYSLITLSIFNLFTVDSKVVHLLIGMVLCVLVPTGITSLLFWKTEEFTYCKDILVRFIRKKLKKE